MVEALLLAVTRIGTFEGEKGISNATGFFFERDGDLFLITNRHVVLDEPTSHRPDRLEIELHTSAENVAEITTWEIPLYDGEQPLWRGATDAAGNIDVVAIPLDRAEFPPAINLHAFTPDHLLDELERIEVGTPLLITGFPLDFHDTLHHLPVSRQAVVASAFGLRFQGQGFFLTDGRMHRGASGSPVVTRTRRDSGRETLPWTLLGVHASRFDVTNRDQEKDEALGLNCAWYADVIKTLTDPPAPVEEAPAEAPAPVAPAPPAADKPAAAPAKKATGREQALAS